jgi:hypothetical protein
MNKENIVLFLGAGFSRDAGFPTMAGFGKESIRSAEELRIHASSGVSPRLAGDMLIGAAKMFHQFQELCRKSPPLTDDDVNNMETIFCIAEAIYESGEKDISIQGESCNLKNLIENIQLWLWKIYQQLPPINQKRIAEVKEDTYKRLFQFLSPQNTTIITTNYDIVFEYYSSTIGIPCLYPVRESKEIGINDSTKGQNKFAFISDEKTSNGFKVCKLHGSVNYFYKSQSDMETIDILNEMGNGTQIGKSGKWPPKWPVVLAVDAIAEIKSKYGQEVTPAIVPPTYSKLTQKRWLRSIWNAAFTALRNADKIIFIGYSMPESDGFMKALFNGALATRNNSKEPKVYLIDKSKDVFYRYCDFWGKLLDKTYEPMTLDFAVESCLPIILGGGRRDAR